MYRIVLVSGRHRCTLVVGPKMYSIYYGSVYNLTVIFSFMIIIIIIFVFIKDTEFRIISLHGVNNVCTRVSSGDKIRVVQIVIIIYGSVQQHAQYVHCTHNNNNNII